MDRVERARKEVEDTLKQDLFRAVGEYRYEMAKLYGKKIHSTPRFIFLQIRGIQALPENTYINIKFDVAL